jgi:hypothetical protein
MGADWTQAGWRQAYTGKGVATYGAQAAATGYEAMGFEPDKALAYGMLSEAALTIGLKLAAPTLKTMAARAVPRPKLADFKFNPQNVLTPNRDLGRMLVETGKMARTKNWKFSSAGNLLEMRLTPAGNVRRFQLARAVATQVAHGGAGVAAERALTQWQQLVQTVGAAREWFTSEARYPTLVRETTYFGIEFGLNYALPRGTPTTPAASSPGGRFGGAAGSIWSGLRPLLVNP